MESFEYRPFFFPNRFCKKTLSIHQHQTATRSVSRSVRLKNADWCVCVCMTSASELFYNRRSRYNSRTATQDLGFDSLPPPLPDRNHNHNRRHHNHHHESEGCDPLLRRTPRHLRHRSSLPVTFFFLFLISNSAIEFRNFLNPFAFGFGWSGASRNWG